MRAALKNAVAGHVRQGASTITQQLARNSFELKGKTFRRKLLEMFVARRIEDNFSKQKIMELYLNRIYFGGGLYGAEAAARGYFDKPAREMTLAECATLAGLVKSPNKLSPWADRDGFARGAQFRPHPDGGTRLHQPGAIAQRAGRGLDVGNRQNARGQNYAIDYIRQQVIAAVGWDRAMSDGFRIHTTIDAKLQNVAEKSLRAQLDAAEQTPGYNHQTYAAIRPDPKGTRENQAARKRKRPARRNICRERSSRWTTKPAASSPWSADAISSITNTIAPCRRAARRGPRCSLLFTPPPLQKGLYPGSMVEDSALDNRTVMIGGTTGILGEWGPENADNHYEGPITARAALARRRTARRSASAPPPDSIRSPARP